MSIFEVAQTIVTPRQGSYVPLSLQFLDELPPMLAAAGIKLPLPPDLLKHGSYIDTDAGRQMLLAHRGGVPSGAPRQDYSGFFKKLEWLRGFPQSCWPQNDRPRQRSRNRSGYSPCRRIDVAIS